MSKLTGGVTNNLRTRFRDYYTNAKIVHKRLIAEAVYVLDTNVLLNMYRIPKSSREQLLNDLQAKTGQLWMPFQVALELHRNCDMVRSTQTKSHSERIQSINDFTKTMSLNGKSTRLESSAEQEAALQALKEWKAKLELENEEIREDINHQKPDEVLERIADIFGDAIGDEPSKEDQERMQKEAQERYKERIPPGYADGDKKDERGAGDYIVWKQTMEYAKATGKDIVFVTDDNKEDWKFRLNSKVLRARPELIVEFQKSTDQDILIIDSNTFFYEISSAKASKGAEVARKDLSEVVRDDDERIAIVDQILKSRGSEKYDDIENYEWSKFITRLSQESDLGIRDVLDLEESKLRRDHDLVIKNLEFRLYSAERELSLTEHQLNIAQAKLARSEFSDDLEEQDARLARIKNLESERDRRRFEVAAIRRKLQQRTEELF